MAADIAICIGANQRQCSHFLDVAKSLLSSLSSAGPSLLRTPSKPSLHSVQHANSSSSFGFDDFPEAIASLKNYLSRVEKLLSADLGSTWTVGSLAVETSLARRLSLIESFPTETSSLTAYLQLRSSLRSAADSLHQSLAVSRPPQTFTTPTTQLTLTLPLPYSLPS